MILGSVHVVLHQGALCLLLLLPGWRAILLQQLAHCLQCLLHLAKCATQAITPAAAAAALCQDFCHR
jgi:hypothetical protein